MIDPAELRGLFLFDGLDDDRLAELAALAEPVAFVDGEELFVEGLPADSWWVLLEGRVELVKRAELDLVTVGAMEQPGQWAGGFRAWTDSAGYMATGRASGDGRILRLDAAALHDLVQSWFAFGVHLIEGFFQTVRNMEAQSRQRAGLVALGKIAAGLAHEINNPAAAATRAADALRDASTELVDSLVLLAQRSLSGEQFAQMDVLRRRIDPSSAATDALSVADREDELLDWLESHGVTEAWRLAPTLAAAGVDTDWCDELAGVLDDATLTPGLTWVAGTLTAVGLIDEVREATGRVSSLVSDVRSYTNLDRAEVQEIDVVDGLESTLKVLGQHLGGVQVERDYDPERPRIEAYPGELNQVWTNLISNAVDAMDGLGTLRLVVRTVPVAASDGADAAGIEVQVGDSGPGMPAEVQERAFEPFFTTKDVGKGTGLGLDISRRIVLERHRGTIRIDSAPGDTVFTVRLPHAPT